MRPDDYVNDDAPIGPTPGTDDDLPYTMGVELAGHADIDPLSEQRKATGAPSRRAEEPERDLGAGDARELWRTQRPLIEEDERDGVKLAGLSDEQARRVLDAMGDDVADPLPDSPGGTSATGAVSPLEPEHGGFPGRVR